MGREAEGKGGGDGWRMEKRRGEETRGEEERRVQKRREEKTALVA